MASFIETKLLCPRCGEVHIIYRKTAKQKKVGHYKKFYCYKCKSEHNHIELNPNYEYDADTLVAMIEEMKQKNKYFAEV